MIIETGQIWKMKRVNSREVFIDNIIEHLNYVDIYYRDIGEAEPHANKQAPLKTFLLLFELKTKKTLLNEYIYYIYEEEYVMTMFGLIKMEGKGHTSYEIRDI